MTRDQKQQIASVTTRIHYLTAGGVPRDQLRRALFAEGWPAAAIDAATKATEQSR
jgi:hypothetical protein